MLTAPTLRSADPALYASPLRIAAAMGVDPFLLVERAADLRLFTIRDQRTGLRRLPVRALTSLVSPEDLTSEARADRYDQIEREVLADDEDRTTTARAAVMDALPSGWHIETREVEDPNGSWLAHVVGLVGPTGTVRRSVVAATLGEAMRRLLEDARVIRLGATLSQGGWTIVPDTHARNCVDAIAPDGERRWLIAVEAEGKSHREIAGDLDFWANDPPGHAQVTWVVPADVIEDPVAIAKVLVSAGRKGFRGKGLFRASREVEA